MLACASMGAPAKGSWGSYQAWWAEGNRKQGYTHRGESRGGGPKEGFSPGLGAPWGETKARPRKYRRGRGPKEAYPVGKRLWALGHRERGFLG